MTNTPELHQRPYPAIRRPHIFLTALLLLVPALHATQSTGTSTPSTNWRGAWSGTNTYAVNDLVSYNGGMYVDIVPTAPVTTTTTASGGNLFDKTAVVPNIVVLASNGATPNIGGFQTSGYINVTGASSFITNITINVFDPYGAAFYDSNKAFLAGTELQGNGIFPAGTPIPVPATAHYVRFWWQIGVMGTTLDAAIVNAGTTLQTTYSAFGASGAGVTTSTTTPSALPTDTTHWANVTATAATTGAAAGKKMFLLGDSIVWANPAVASQIASLIGATLSGQGSSGPGVDGVPGRSFDEFANGQNPPLSPAVLSDVDLLVIALGTNQDSAAGLGTPSDSPSLTGTMSAQMRLMLETIMGWKPGMRIIVIGPYQSNRYNVLAGADGLLGTQDTGKTMANAGSINVLRNINTTMKAVCNLYAVPYVDMFNESGVNFTTSALWLTDGLHPNTTGYTAFYVPYIAAQLTRYIP